ncbi:MAG: DUF4293 domain-containing protein [Bacteroidales bacterium]|nr:DUF4293 domain-containing protein [Bacteroidales bacterium]
MIQRIQTLFLLLALVCMAIFYFVPFGSLELTTETGISDVPMGLYGVNFGEEHYSTLPLLILLSFVVLTLIFTIFLFKHRILQMRICVFNLILALGCSGLAFFFLYQASEKFATNYSTSILVVLPVVAAIFIALAIRGIAKDEALIRSIDRIR